MRTFSKSNYPNLFDSCDLNTKSICNEIKNYKLEFIQIRNNRIEWGVRLPTFLTPFYKNIYLKNRILEQKEFYKYYLSENIKYFEQHKFNQNEMLGLKARIYRTYPSLVRDIHFSTYLKENFLDGDIIYNRKLDVIEGIDLLIEYQGLFYGVNLYTDTIRAHAGRKKKERRHSKFNNIIYIELPVNFKGSLKVGHFFCMARTN